MKAHRQPCGKRPYSSKKEAQTMRNAILKGKRRMHRPGNLRIYACPICPNGTWHLAK